LFYEVYRLEIPVELDAGADHEDSTSVWKTVVLLTSPQPSSSTKQQTTNAFTFLRSPSRISSIAFKVQAGGNSKHRVIAYTSQRSKSLEKQPIRAIRQQNSRLPTRTIQDNQQQASLRHRFKLSTCPCHAPTASSHLGYPVLRHNAKRQMGEIALADKDGRQTGLFKRAACNSQSDRHEAMLVGIGRNYNVGMLMGILLGG
jgi:hypothetical protein